MQTRSLSKCDHHSSRFLSARREGDYPTRDIEKSMYVLVSPGIFKFFLNRNLDSILTLSHMHSRRRRTPLLWPPFTSNEQVPSHIAKAGGSTAPTNRRVQPRDSTAHPRFPTRRGRLLSIYICVHAVMIPSP